jgi:hypothetical protein
MNFIFSAFKNINKYKIAYFFSFFSFIFSIIIFFIFSQFSQFSQINKLSINFFQKTNIHFELFIEVINTISLPILLAIIIYFILFYLVTLSSFAIFFLKRDLKFKNQKLNHDLKNKKTTFFGIFSYLFSFLGFGCIACGQALILSILSFFFTGITITFAYTISYFLLFLGSILLLYILNKNLKILSNPNICPL